MKEKVISNFAIYLIFCWFPLSIHTQTDTLLHFLEPFIGNWYGVLDEETMQKFPDRANSIGFKFEWAHDNHKLVHFYEGIPEGDMDKRYLEALVAANPHTGVVEFVGYQLRNDFLFKGRFEPLMPGNGFVRLYDVYYPEGTKFRYKADKKKGMKSYRDICRLTGKDTLECTTEQLDFGQWKPWGKGEPFLLVRKAGIAKPMPKWLLEDWENRTKDKGIWIADNAAYKSEQEPFDAYGLKWELGLGGKHLKGRLYCIKAGNDIGTVWQFTEYWNPEKGKVEIMQIGSDGTLGQGEIWLEKSGKQKEQQIFTSPGGSTFEVGHLAWMENDEQHTQSYNIIDGEWQKRRYYIWKRKSSTEVEVQEEFKRLAFLIGEWQINFSETGSAKMKFTWGENQRLIHYQNSHRFKPEDPYKMESQGIITYHGVKDQLIFMNAYTGEGDYLISEGRYEFDNAGTIHRFFTCHYKEGETLPWSDGAKAPKGGKSIDFKQIWVPVDANSFHGDFYWKKNGKWEHPIKNYEGKKVKEVWKRIK